MDIFEGGFSIVSQLNYEKLAFRFSINSNQFASGQFFTDSLLLVQKAKIGLSNLIISSANFFFFTQVVGSLVIIGFYSEPVHIVLNDILALFPDN